VSSDLSEKALETLIVGYLTSETGGWLAGDPADYDREYAIDMVQVTAFLQATQPEQAAALDLDHDGPTRRKFLGRLQGEITRRGVVDVLRKGVKHGPYDLDLFYGTPSPGNALARERYARNRFTVTRQLRYSRDQTQLALDAALFVNGLPVATFELKNKITKQTAEDAVEQYKRDRDSRELIFQPGRCMVHFAVDDQVIRFCAELKGKYSWFLPFDRGYEDGAGNPPNPDGLKTDYLWKRILAPDSLTNIIENYAQVVTEKDARTGRKKSQPIFPRYHQLDVVRRLLADGAAHGAGRRYLIQHSAGSGKSNSIAWLAHQLIGLEHAGKRVFDSILVVTDRVNLDGQLNATIRQFTQVRSTVTHVRTAAELRAAIEAGKKIIITTVQKFPFIYKEIGDAHRGNTFAIIIDEAHSSQGGRTTARMSEALADAGALPDDESVEDAINRVMDARKMLTNASYYAFTATPKNKTLEIFGEPYRAEGVTKHRPFHSYTMKQAIQERFILDVLANYTQVNSYYRLIKTIEGDPEFDARKACKKLRRFVEDNDHAIRLKAEIMVDHFHDHVLALNKVGGQARAMVVTSRIDRALKYHFAIQAYLRERKSPYRAIVAFSGEPEFGDEVVSEARLNGFPSREISDRFRNDPTYRFLVCADKFQTGYDEPLLHTMYVDKTLSGIKAVQTLSRLNRAHPQKYDTMVLDFVNEPDVIQRSFADYYRTTLLSEETDPNKLHDLEADLDDHGVYDSQQVEDFVGMYLTDAPRERLDPILDACAGAFTGELDEDSQVDFKGKAKAFVRTYGFLAAILPFTNAAWEKLSIFLNFLVPKLPAPVEEDLTRGLLETVDMDSYRVEKQATMKIVLADTDAEIDPVPASGGGYRPESERDLLSNIVATFNEQWGNVRWEDGDRVRRLISQDIPARVAADGAYRNAMRNNDAQNARIEHDKALARVMVGVLRDDMDLYKLFSDNDAFKKWLTSSMFLATYAPPAEPIRMAPGSSDAGTGDGAPGSDAAPGEKREEPPEGEAGDRPPTRYLTGSLPERAPAGRPISLQVQITMAAPTGPSAALRPLAVPQEGRTVTIIVAAPGLESQGDLEQDVRVPAAGNSDPVRFRFTTGRAGLHAVTVRAFAGGTFLAELGLQISVEVGAVLEEGPPQSAIMDGLAAEPGEVTLQVNLTDEGRYSFQLIGEALYPIELTRRLAGDPAEIVQALVDELRAMAGQESPYASPRLVRNRIRSLGTQLWADVVPESIKRQFWEQAGRIRLFTIASDMDTVPWELLYPMDRDNDNGFLVKQFPVVRRVYGQGRARHLPLTSAGFVVPPGSPADAMDEVDAVRACLGAHIEHDVVCTQLKSLLGLLDTPPSVLHFACHNKFSERAGSVISLGGGPLRPGDLAPARLSRSMAAASPLVFINACRTAGEIPGMMEMMGWAKQFMGAGAGAFVGSLWAIRSDSARSFADVFYRALVVDGQPLGAASHQARQAIAEDEGDPTWLAYTIYGNPAATIR
jgi:type I restriction enzyme, R subunit